MEEGASYSNENGFFKRDGGDTHISGRTRELKQLVTTYQWRRAPLLVTACADFSASAYGCESCLSLTKGQIVHCLDHAENGVWQLVSSSHGLGWVPTEFLEFFHLRCKLVKSAYLDWPAGTVVCLCSTQSDDSWQCVCSIQTGGVRWVPSSSLKPFL